MTTQQTTTEVVEDEEHLLMVSVSDVRAAIKAELDEVSTFDLIDEPFMPTAWMQRDVGGGWMDVDEVEKLADRVAAFLMKKARES